ncbi:hypothetical protein [Micromonospora globbae]|uniref:hypothetical protein n=1 Tax=Micromonospora globbae TaxID=1894969 RepID=UPI00341B130E
MRGHIDTRHVDSDGVRYRVDIDPDPDASPNEFDCYDRADINAFRAGRWRYVTVTVTVDSAGVDISDQLGAVEYGTLPHTSIDVDRLVADHPVPDMILTCRHQLADLHNRLGRLPLAEPDTLTLRISTAQARTIHNALQMTERHWAQAAAAAHAAAQTPRPAAATGTPATTEPDTLDVEPTPSGHRGIAHIALGEQATYRKLADWLGALIDAAETR